MGKRSKYYDYIATSPEGESYINTFDDIYPAQETRKNLLKNGWTLSILHTHSYSDDEKIAIMEMRCDETSERLFELY